MGRVHPPLFCRAAWSRGSRRRARRDCCLRAADPGGWLERSPDYKAAFLATLGVNADFYAPYQDNARRWYKHSQERIPYVNHAIILPPVDRHMVPGAPAGPTEIYAHVTRETDAGIVSG